MIHLVTALRAEAQPFVEALGLRPEQGETEARVLAGRGVRLVVSGVGRSAAARAAQALHDHSAGESAIWINVGVAAHRELPIGTLLLGHKIIEVASGRCWYPRLVVPVELPTAVINTVDRPVERPPTDGLYEMEAAGFFATAMRWTTSELAACVKVVSDHGIAEGEPFSRDLVRDLIGGHVDAVLAFARDLEAAMHGARPDLVQVDLEPALERWHFSLTQRRALERLARRALALETRVGDHLPEASPNATRVLAYLESALDSVASSRL